MNRRPQNVWHNIQGITPEEMKEAEAETLRRYGDILDLPRPPLEGRRRNPPGSRAAQFSPFAALVGFDAEIETESRHVESRIELSDLQKEEVNEALVSIQGILRECPEVEMSVFEEDPEKEGGFYRTRRGRVRKIDVLAECLILADGTKVFFADIRQLRLL